MSSADIVVVFVPQILILIAVGFVFLQLFRQQGRILLRLDALERGTSAGSETRSGPAGLAIGTAIQDFQLPNLSGQTVALSDFRGHRVLLIYWSPECGFCDMAAKDLARLQIRLEKNDTRMVLVSYGNAEANRELAAEHGLKCPILLIKDSPAEKILANEIFQYCGTPSAYLLDEQGKVSRPLVFGMDEVLQVAREAGGAIRRRPVTQSRIEREGLKAGTPAPQFNLPSIGGETVSLEQYRGRKVLLVFSDPQCGPCDEVAPQLARLHRKHRNNGMALVMVGRGDAEQNKKKVMEHDITFPVVLQDRWKLSKEYGIFATPVAFLIGKDGIIMRNVAKGPQQIMSLAQEGLASN